MAVSTDEIEQRWSDWLLHRNRSGMRGLLWIVVTMYPMFGVLDYLIAPREWLWLLYGTRGVITVITLIMFRVVSTNLFARHPNSITAAYMITAALGISLMTVFMGGLSSPYYAGLTLAIVATGLLFVWPTRVVVATHATIIVSFLVPNLLIGHEVDLMTAVSNQFFLISTAIIAGTGQTVAYRSQREQVQNQLTLETTTEHLEKAHDKLKQLDKFKSEFFANITHELKTPLTMMLSPIELVLDGQLGRVTDAQRSTFQSMQRSGMKLFRLIGDLLDLSKLEESRLRLRIAERDLVAYLRGLVTQVRPLAERKSISLRFDAEVERAVIWCDLERIERVFINLLSNATKFTEVGGNVVVRVSAEAEAIRVDVCDDGVGFPEDMCEAVFERFVQADMAGTRRYGGAGIGLALAKELVELHGGHIWATAAEGRGATFTVRFPTGREHFDADVLERRGNRRSDRPRSEHPAGQRVTDHTLAEWQLDAPERFRLMDIDEATEQRLVERDTDEQLRNYSVLIVEDTPDVTRMIRLSLHHEFLILAATDGRSGLEMALKRKPTLVITDWMMPEMDGLELTAKLRQHHETKHIPVVMLTARGDVEDRVQGLDSGVNAYLPKPFSAKVLRSTVRSLLREREETADEVLSHNMDSLETIAGGMAHEIRNPLNYIKNALIAVQKDTAVLLRQIPGASDDSEPRSSHVRPRGEVDLAKLDARMQKMFEVARAGVTRISGTVDLMMRYSREGYSRDVLPCDVGQAISDVVSVVAPAVGRNVDISVETQAGLYVECVAEEFNQVLTNLVQNALEAVADDGTGRVSVTARLDDERVNIVVEDNGAGISRENQARIFNPFFTTKEAGMGMGMGLTISHRVVRSMGGRLSVKSELGEGTQFRISLPHVVELEAVG